MSKPNLAMPASLARRPQYRGMPIPYMSPIGRDGVPLFSVDNEVLKLEVMHQRLCGLCGEKLGQWIGFIGDMDCMLDRIFEQPGMHIDCLQYAASICPYIARTNYQVHTRAKITGQVENIILLNAEMADYPRPERMLIYVTSDYEIIGGGPTLAARVAPHRKIIWIDKV